MRGNGSDRTSRDGGPGTRRAGRPVLSYFLVFAVARLTVTTRICNGVSKGQYRADVGRTDQTRYTAGELWVMVDQLVKGVGVESPGSQARSASLGVCVGNLKPVVALMRRKLRK